MVRPRISLKILINLFVFGLLSGCGMQLTPGVGQLFFLPLEVEGEQVGTAFVDTGGEFEVLLASRQGLDIVGELDVVAFTGQERVQITEPFQYRVLGRELRSAGAIVGLSVCDCNGLGLGFLKRVDKALELDFQSGQVSLVSEVPSGLLFFEFSDQPEELDSFPGAFTDIVVSGNGTSREVTAVIDTGAVHTVISRTVLGDAGLLAGNRLDIRIKHPVLGEVGLSAGVFENSGLPDVILGTDVMQTWGPRWIMDFREGQKGVFVEPGTPPAPDPGATPGVDIS